MKKKCPKCRGTGSVVVDYKDCDSCGGTGYQDSFDVGNHFKGVNSNAKAKFDLGADQDIPCEVCHGKGQIEVFEECPNCHGSGQINVCNDCGKPISEKYDLQVLRFFMLSAHYRSPLNFSADLMAAAKNGLDRILTAAERLHDLADAAEGSMTDAEKENFAASKEYVEKFEAAMEDDANTADAVSAVFELVKFINVNSSEQNSKEYLQALYQRLETLCDVLGIIIEKKEEILDSDIEALIAERQAARKAKNFARADEIRDLLTEKGIILEDTREGVRWKRA